MGSLVKSKIITLLFASVWYCLSPVGLVNAAGADEAVTGVMDEEDIIQPVTVFLLCEGVFQQDSTHPDKPAIEQFDGSLYLSVTYLGDQFTTILLQPFDRDERLPAQRFERESGATKVAATTPVSEQSHIRIDATEDEIILHQARSTGAMVRARVGDRPIVPTQMRVEIVDMTLNRFSGSLQLGWSDRRVHDVKPPGAIRATKVTYSDRNTYDAKCHTMKERLF